MTLKVLILGINGFIGSNLAEQILQKTSWEIYGLDLTTNKIEHLLDHKNLHFTQGDLLTETAWVEDHIQQCAAVLPLVAIANPALYVQDPLRVFELDFEANLAVVKLCARYKKRVIFPSTSEVYGMCPDEEFNEETSNFVLGPINKPRWIYSNCKQLMDRVIHAYGIRDGLPYTLFRPFNWFGPKLDNVLDSRAGSSRALSQFISNIIHGKDIQLVDGGQQRRSFTYIDDGVAALMRIIENRDNCATDQIFNVGNPNNDISIKELAEMLIALIKTYPKYTALAEKTQLIEVPAKNYFGEGYQDVSRRVPSIKNAEKCLGWKPTVDLQTGLKKTLDFYLTG